MSPDRDRDVQKDPIVVEISVHQGPIAGIVVSPDGSRLMVTNYGGDSVSIIDTDSCRVVETVSGVQEPFAIAVTGPEASVPNRVYVSSVSRAYDSIEVIDVSTNTVVATHPLALSVSDLVASADGRVRVRQPKWHRQCRRRRPGHHHGPGRGDRHRGTRHHHPVRAHQPGRGPPVRRHQRAGRRKARRARCTVRRPFIGTRALAPEKAHPFSRNTGLTVTGVVEIGLAVRDVAVSPDGDVAYVASCCPEVGAVVDVVDTRTNKITSTRKLGEISGNLTGCTLSRDGDRAYLVSDDGITVLCTLTQDVIGTVAVTEQPSCVVESPDGKRLYVADYSGAVIVAAVAPTAPLAIEGAAPRSHASAEWVMPELLHYEPALGPVVAPVLRGNPFLIVGAAIAFARPHMRRCSGTREAVHRWTARCRTFR